MVQKMNSMLTNYLSFLLKILGQQDAKKLKVFFHRIDKIKYLKRVNAKSGRTKC